MKKCKESGYYLVEETEITRSNIPVQPEGTMFDFLKDYGIASEESRERSFIKDKVIYKKSYFKLYGRYFYMEEDFMISEVQLIINEEGIVIDVDADLKYHIPISDSDYTLYFMTNGNKIIKEEYIMALKKALLFLNPGEDKHNIVSLLLKDEKK